MIMHEAAMFFRLQISYCQVGCQRLEPTEKAVYGSQKACKIAMLGVETSVLTSLGYGMYKTFDTKGVWS